MGTGDKFGAETRDAPRGQPGTVEVIKGEDGSDWLVVSHLRGELYVCVNADAELPAALMLVKKARD